MYEGSKYYDVPAFRMYILPSHTSKGPSDLPKIGLIMLSRWTNQWKNIACLLLLVLGRIFSSFHGSTKFFRSKILTIEKSIPQVKNCATIFPRAWRFWGYVLISCKNWRIGTFLPVFANFVIFGQKLAIFGPILGTFLAKITKSTFSTSNHMSDPPSCQRWHS